jgi:predicted Zn-dependent protease
MQAIIRYHKESCQDLAAMAFQIWTHIAVSNGIKITNAAVVMNLHSSVLAADDEAELAGVMAHEIAHVAACHAARENTRGQLLSLASIPLVIMGGPIGYVGYEAAGLALPMTFLRFSRV